MKCLILLSIVGLAIAGIQNDCLQCICKLEGCQGQIGKCRDDVGSLSCGPYQIKEDYWIDAGKPDGDYQKCTKEMECSERTIQAYMDRYGPQCRSGPPTCEDYMRMHNGGPTACKEGTDQYTATNGYWQRAKEQCGF